MFTLRIKAYNKHKGNNRAPFPPWFVVYSKMKGLVEEHYFMPQIDPLAFLDQITFLLIIFTVIAPLAFIIITEKTLLIIKQVKRW